MIFYIDVIHLYSSIYCNNTFYDILNICYIESDDVLMRYILYFSILNMKAELSVGGNVMISLIRSVCH